MAERGDAFEGWFDALPEADAAVVSSVADLLTTSAFCAALGAHLRRPLTLHPDAGLELAVRRPETVGRDRLYAARGALDWTGGAALVLDAGTALTVDAVRALEGAAYAGVFLGGAIAPGPALLASALARGGARLPHVQPEPDVPALGRDTEAALRAGIGVGFAGAALELARGVAAESGLTDAPIVLTGGARAFLRETLAREFDVREDEHLVHRGLAAAASGR